MGLTTSRQSIESHISRNDDISKSYLIIERMIDADCDIFNHVSLAGRNLRFGICNNTPDSKNPFANQCISIPGEEPKLLQRFEEHPKSLRYIFDRNIELTFMKRDNNDVYYHLKTPTHEVTRPIAPIIKNNYKTMSVGNPCELDKVETLFK